MELKNNPRAALNRESGLFFEKGLVLILFNIWRALEFKNYDTLRKVVIKHRAVTDLNEDVTITETLKTSPPQAPPSALEFIKIVDDTKEIEETVIQSTEINQETVIDAPVISVDKV